MNKIKLYLLTGIFALTLILVSSGHAAAQQDVNIVNTVQNPVPTTPVGKTLVQSVDEPARQPYQTSVFLNFDQGQFNQTISLPLGKRLVIEYVSAGMYVNSDRYITRVSIETAFNGSSINHFMLPTKTGTNPVIGNTFNVAQQTRLYTDNHLQVHVFPSSFSGVAGGAAVSISGYLVDIGPTRATVQAQPEQ
jgi:hypothetical protein